MLQILFNLLSSNQHLMSSWMPVGLVKEISNHNQRIQIFSPQNVWVHSSFFQNIRENMNEGGAILMKTKSNRTCLLVEETYFINCFSYEYGPIFQEPGNLLLHSVCCSFSGCEKTLMGLLVYSRSANSNDHFQEIEYCSFTHIFNEYSNQEEVIFLQYGCSSINSLNISQTKFEDIFTIYFNVHPGYPYNSIQYSSFVNNSDSNYRIKYLFFCVTNALNCYMCNILLNYAKGIFSLHNQLTIKNSCILDNEYDKLVFLASSSYSASLYNCTCQNASSNLQTRIYTYNVPSSSFLHALDCLNTGDCIAEYDYLDDLKPYIPSYEDDAKIATLSNKHVKKGRVFF